MAFNTGADDYNDVGDTITLPADRPEIFYVAGDNEAYLILHFVNTAYVPFMGKMNQPETAAVPEKLTGAASAAKPQLSIPESETVIDNSIRILTT